MRPDKQKINSLDAFFIFLNLPGSSSDIVNLFLALRGFY
ncbi:hypothetical protein CSC17_0425 [Klebsiella oxytoca]|nr:hypothetical protein CSC17_0425 [Klebsiella oxytoca]